MAPATTVFLLCIIFAFRFPQITGFKITGSNFEFESMRTSISNATQFVSEAKKCGKVPPICKEYQVLMNLTSGKVLTSINMSTNRVSCPLISFSVTAPQFEQLVPRNDKEMEPNLITGEMQSPIDINTSMTNTVKDCSQARIHFVGHMLPRNFTLWNNGEFAKMNFTAKPPQNETLHISSGLLKSTYIFHSLHFHWGKNMTNGSEHSVNGKKYAGEIHAIFYKHMCGSYEFSKSNSNHTVILAILLQESNTPNLNLKPIIDGLQYVQTTHNRTLLSKLIPMSAILPSSTSKYWMYQGSLTKCPYFETAIWVVFSEPVKISRRQIRKFRSLKEGPTSTADPLLSNIRETQPLCGRSVNWIDC